MEILWWPFLVGAAFVFCFSLPLILRDSEKCKHIILRHLQTINPSIKDLTSKQFIFLSVIISILFAILWPPLLAYTVNKIRNER